MKHLLGSFLVVANVLLLALWLIGFLGAYLNPAQYWITGLVATVLPLLSLALAPFAIVHATARRWIVVAVHVAMMLVVVDRHWSVDRFSRPDALRRDWTLMTFNTPRDPDTEEAMKQVNALVSGVRPDLIGLQEFSIWASKRDPNRIRAHAKFREVVDSMGYVTLPPRDGPDDVSWVHWVQPLLTMHDIESQEQLTFEREISGWPKLEVLRTVMVYDGRRFAHYNVHLFTHGPSKPWNGDGGWLELDRWIQFLSQVRTAFRIRAWQAEQIRLTIDREALPVILSGDFNATPDNWSYWHLSEDMQDAFREAGDGWGATYHSEFPLLRIDFVLLGPEFEPVRARVPGEYVLESDHMPLVVRFRWREGSGGETGVASDG